MTCCRAISLHFSLADLSTFDQLLFLGFQLLGYFQCFLDYIFFIRLIVIIITPVIVVQIHNPI